MRHYFSRTTSRFIAVAILSTAPPCAGGPPSQSALVEANIHFLHNRLGEARAIYEKELAIRVSDPTTVDLRSQILMNLGDIDLLEHQPELARQRFVRALSLREAKYGVDSPRLVPTLERLYRALQGLPDSDRTQIEVLNRILAIEESALPRNSKILFHTVERLKYRHDAIGDREKSAKYSRRMYEMRKSEPGWKTNPLSAAFAATLGVACFEVGKFKEADGLMQEAIDLSKGVHGIGTPTTTSFILKRVWMLENSGRTRQAEKLLAQAMADLQLEELNPLERADVVVETCRQVLGPPPAAVVRLLETTASTLEKVDTANSIVDVQVMTALSNEYTRHKRWSQARTISARAFSRAVVKTGPQSETTLSALDAFARACSQDSAHPGLEMLLTAVGRERSVRHGKEELKRIERQLVRLPEYPVIKDALDKVLSQIPAR